MAWGWLLSQPPWREGARRRSQVVPLFKGSPWEDWKKREGGPGGEWKGKGFLDLCPSYDSLGQEPAKASL